MTRTAIKSPTAHFDFDRPLKWSKPDDMIEVETLIKHPPIHSVVAQISPSVAEKILMRYNTRNRNLKPYNVSNITHAVSTDLFALTGDTIKFAKNGVLVDGQHRLKACVDAKHTLTTHVVFGLQNNIFDVLDQGAKRTAADVLGMDGVVDAVWMASAVRWAIALERQTIPKRLVLSAREILALVSTGGRLEDLIEYLPEARKIYISQSPRQSPSFLTAYLHCVGSVHRKPKLVEEIVSAWTSEKHVGRNETFDVLGLRIQSLAKQSGGRPDPYIRAAFTVQAINAWNAGLVVNPRALSWAQHQRFPALELDAKAYLKRREKNPDDLTDRQKAVLDVFLSSVNGHKTVQISLSDLAVKSGVARSSVPHIIDALTERETIRIHKHPTETEPAVYKVLAG